MQLRLLRMKGVRVRQRSGVKVLIGSEREEMELSTEVFVGSTNRSKVGAGQAVFRAWLPDCTVRGVSVPSGVSVQPIGAVETRSGAINRARKARGGRKAWGIGMEGGVEFGEDGAFLINWCAVVAPNGKLSVAQGVSLPLPDEVGKAVAEGQELGPVMKSWTGRSDLSEIGGAIGYLTLGHVSRLQLWEQALWCALSPFLLDDRKGGTAE